MSPLAGTSPGGSLKSSKFTSKAVHGFTSKANFSGGATRFEGMGHGVSPLFMPINNITYHYGGHLMDRASCGGLKALEGQSENKWQEGMPDQMPA
jgi:hypothetical protein